MTATQVLLGDILKRRINNQLTLTQDKRDFITIETDMDILLAGGKITSAQYEELTELMAVA